MATVLIVEDEEIIRGSLRRLLQRHNHEVIEAGSVDEALSLDRDGVDLVISDLRLPGRDGTAMIAAVAPIPVLIMTSYSSVSSAVEAMKLGAADYISKPFNHDEMVLTVARILERTALENQNQILKQELSRSYPVQGMIGDCPAMRAVFERIERVATTDATVLILGESGTGKELVARAIHAQSQRKDAQIITVNCAAIPDNLLESELFGHEKGAFTGATKSHRGLIESADGGTLFLDEVGELPLDAQARLLRVLQEGEIRRVGSNQTRHVDIRLLAATHRDLQQQVEEGGFREDLFYRLHVMEITLPPLRERGADISALAEACVERQSATLSRPGIRLSDEAHEALQGYYWPGNVRELDNVIQRAVILTQGELIQPEDLSLTEGSPETAPSSDTLPLLSLDDYFIEAVKQHQDQMSETKLAAMLGISRKTLWERRQRLGISRD